VSKMAERRKILAGSGTFFEKAYAYEKLAKSVAEARSVLPDNVALDFVLLVGDRPDKKAEDLTAINNAFHAAGTPVTVLDMDDMPDTENHWQWNSRRIIWYKENYLADLALRRYTDFLSWEADVATTGDLFKKRIELWLEHSAKGQVMCAMMPYNDVDAPDKKKYLAYNFIPAQLRVDEPVQIASFVTKLRPSKHGVRSSSRRFKFSKKNDNDDLVLCEQRKQCITWLNTTKENADKGCQGSNHQCPGYAPPEGVEVYQEAAWAIADPKLKPGKDGTGSDDYIMTQLGSKPVKDLLTLPKAPDGLFRAHGGHLGFTLIPAYLFRRIHFRYKPWVKQHPDTWFFLDCAKKDIPVFLDLDWFVEHDHREWSKEVGW